MFINDLLNELELANNCANVGHIRSCNPGFADDITCINLTPNGLQTMLDTAYQYSCKWRFQFNSGKSNILCYNQKLHNDQTLEFSLGDSKIKPSNASLHLGTTDLLSTSDIDSSCRKGRNAYFAIVGMGSQTLNPLTVTSLYSKVVVPTVLYGCEMWNNLSKKDLCNLQIFQHFVVKHIQGMHRRTRSDMCETMLDLFRLTVVVEERKFMFLQKLCQIEPNILSIQIFTFRLFQCLLSPDRKQLGFIPDTIGILQKYSLSSHLMNYIFTGNFPSKFAWKNIINNTINDFEHEAKLLRM